MVPKASSPVSMTEQLQASANQIWSSMKHLEQTMKSSPEKGNNDAQEGPQVSLESVIRIMFGSCTTGMSSEEHHPSCGPDIAPSRNSTRKMSQSTCEPASPTKSEDNLYKHLFADERMKAEDAVCHLREQMEQQREYRSPPRNICAHNGTDVPAVFPASSPKDKSKVADQHIRNAPSNQVPRTQPAVNEISFDDEISAISQHTLEELAALHQGDNGFLERVHSDVTQDPVEALEESWKHTVNPNRDSSPNRTNNSPLRFQRTGRSQGTLNTKQTMGTKSTMSTQTNEFANMLRRDEQRYWQEVVQEQEESEDPAGDSIGISSRHEKLIRARERLRRRDMKFRRDGTSTTVNSSVFSGKGSHDFGVNVFHHDPDRFMDVVLVPPGTEIGEI